MQGPPTDGVKQRRLPREAGDSELSLSQQNRTQSRGRSNTDRVELGLMRCGLAWGRRMRSGEEDNPGEDGQEVGTGRKQMVKSGPFRPQEVRDIKGSGHGIHWRAFFFLFSFF